MPHTHTDQGRRADGAQQDEPRPTESERRESGIEKKSVQPAHVRTTSDDPPTPRHRPPEQPPHGRGGGRVRTTDPPLPTGAPSSSESTTQTAKHHGATCSSSTRPEHGTCTRSTHHRQTPNRTPRARARQDPTRTAPATEQGQQTQADETVQAARAGCTGAAGHAADTPIQERQRATAQLQSHRNPTRTASEDSDSEHRPPSARPRSRRAKEKRLSVLPLPRSISTKRNGEEDYMAGNTSVKHHQTQGTENSPCGHHTLEHYSLRHELCLIYDGHTPTLPVDVARAAKETPQMVIASPFVFRGRVAALAWLLWAGGAS
nr:BUD13 homolog [Penaeus vannamei]